MGKTDMDKDTGWITVEGKECRFFINGEGGPIVLLGTFPFDTDDSERIFKSVKEISGDVPFLLAVYRVTDWGRDFSPYPGINAFDGSAFSGGGKETLKWLEDHLIPYIKNSFTTDKRVCTAGYSLSGLFALWSLYASKEFNGAACCSGSLWYDGWDSFTAENSINGKAVNVYLSLGRKEEKVRNPVVSEVGNRTREQERLLLNDPAVSNVTLEWNQGGHFADSALRLSKGIGWLLSVIKL